MSRRFHLALIKPSHYDDDGYVIQWWRSAMPSNALAMLYGLAVDCRDRRVLGPEVEIEISALDETNSRVRPERLARRIRRAGAGMVGLVGVQSNQFPRSLDLARRLLTQGVPVVIGGFHPSGVMSMLPELTPELEEARRMGVSLFAGEAEGRFDEVLRDAYRGRLRPVYDYLDDLPDLQGAVTPILEAHRVKRTAGAQGSFDAGRGCPFKCSFCTIINVQGRASRYRAPAEVEKIIRENVGQGIKRFFISDDNFARNRNWEAILDRLIEFRRREGVKFNLVLQVDTLCHRIPGFIEKSRQAGVKRVFIGLENINPDNLKEAQKPQNRITEYRRMLQAWRGAGVITVAGYILGFAADTPESIVRDVQIIQRELPIDILEFFFLTPLPGSEDHQRLFRQQRWMDPDLNRYDLNHVTQEHPRMSKSEWESAYRLAWETYYSHEHIVTLLRRARADGLSAGKIAATAVAFYGSVRWEGVHPLEAGVFRKRFRRDRRPGWPIEGRLQFWRRHAGAVLRSLFGAGLMYLKYRRIRKAIARDPASASYRDAATTPVSDQELEELEMFKVSPAARQAANKQRKLIEIGGKGRATGTA